MSAIALNELPLPETNATGTPLLSPTIKMVPAFLSVGLLASGTWNLPPASFFTPLAVGMLAAAAEDMLIALPVTAAKSAPQTRVRREIPTAF